MNPARLGSSCAEREARGLRSPRPSVAAWPGSGRPRWKRCESWRIAGSGFWLMARTGIPSASITSTIRPCSSTSEGLWISWTDAPGASSLSSVPDEPPPMAGAWPVRSLPAWRRPAGLSSAGWLEVSMGRRTPQRWMPEARPSGFSGRAWTSPTRRRIGLSTGGWFEADSWSVNSPRPRLRRPACFPAEIGSSRRSPKRWSWSRRPPEAEP